MKDLIEFSKLMFTILAFLMICLFVIGSPICWFKGSANARYLNHTQGIDIPWYEAAWLNVDTRVIEAEINLKTP